ncbi:hypothetical protein GCM10027615_34470 [Plantactinospora veratri]
MPHSGQARRRRINWPSSASRESTTRESACRQYGHRIADLLRTAGTTRARGPPEKTDPPTGSRHRRSATLGGFRSAVRT